MNLVNLENRTDIIKSVVGWMKEQDEIILDACKHCLSQVVRSDSDGYRTLEVRFREIPSLFRNRFSQIVQFLGDLIKREKCQCSPKAVEPLLEVRFEDIATLSKEGFDKTASNALKIVQTKGKRNRPRIEDEKCSRSAIRWKSVVKNSTFINRSKTKLWRLKLDYNHKPLNRSLKSFSGSSSTAVIKLIQEAATNMRVLFAITSRRNVLWFRFA